MNRYVSLVVVAGVALSLVGCGPQKATEEKGKTDVGDQEKAVSEIEKLGGKMEFNEKAQGRPVISVELSGTKVTDAGLEHLKGLTQLQQLHLDGTKITDAGVKKLKQALPHCHIDR
jgi:hypothetical protein